MYVALDLHDLSVIIAQRMTVEGVKTHISYVYPDESSGQKIIKITAEEIEDEEVQHSGTV